jgi:putative SbcD/Mre11-related phosphoesterase
MVLEEIRPGVWLDARLALVHRRQGWLAVADVHYGYAAAMRDRGGLFPMWGDETVEERLRALCEDHRPETLVVNGDLVHGRVKRETFAAFLGRLGELAERVVLVAGNHDRSPTARAAGFVDRFRTPGFLFHHGHEVVTAEPGEIEVTGHFHPAVVLRDGAGLRLKLPAFVEETGERTRWILPAFSPWAGGAEWPTAPGRRVRRWGCAPKRILPLVGPGLAPGKASGDGSDPVP